MKQNTKFIGIYVAILFSFALILILFAGLTQNNYQKEIDVIASELEKNNLKCIMTHTPYYDLRISAEIIDENMEKALLRCMKATTYLGAKISAIHPRSVFLGNSPYDESVLPYEESVDTKKSFELNYKYMLPLAEEIAKGGGMLGVENLMQYPRWKVPFYSCNTKDHVRLVDSLKDFNACAIWDFGHSNLVRHDRSNAIRELGSRIKGTHLHNNFSMDDEHLPPSIGNIDWNSTLSALKEQGYNGYLTLEVNYNYNFGINSFIKHLYDCVIKLNDVMN